MKKAYVKPTLDVAEFRFSENIAASQSTTSCYNVNTYTHTGDHCTTTWTGTVAVGNK